MMDTNPYTPPQTRVVDVAGIEQGETPFFAVSLLKLVVMSLVTFGFYEVYWFYKNWKIIKARENANLNPVLRALFGVFFCYSCFKRIRDYGQEKNIFPLLSAGFLAISWIVCSLASALPDPWFWLNFLSIPCFVSVQSYVNRINREFAPDHDLNANFSTVNWVFIVIGGALVLLTLFDAVVGFN